jgi:RNA polymerase sigma factor (sigma-70 family)
MSTVRLPGAGEVEMAWDAGYTDLLRRRRGELLRLALLLTGRREDAEDALHEAVISVAGAWPRVLIGASEAMAMSYLRTAVVRKVTDQHRRRVPTAEPVELAVEDVGFLRVEGDRRFFALLQGLPTQQRAVLVLRYFLDLDDVRIARALGISRGTVRSHAALGLQRLRAGEEVGR